MIHLPPQSLVRHRLMRRRRAPLQRRATRADRWCCSAVARGVGRYSRATRKKNFGREKRILGSQLKGLEELDVEHDEGTVRPAVVPRPEERTKERKKENREQGGMGGRHAAYTRGDQLSFAFLFEGGNLITACVYARDCTPSTRASHPCRTRCQLAHSARGHARLPS